MEKCSRETREQAGDAARCPREASIAHHYAIKPLIIVLLNISHNCFLMRRRPVISNFVHLHEAQQQAVKHVSNLQCNCIIYYAA